MNVLMVKDDPPSVLRDALTTTTLSVVLHPSQLLTAGSP